ncbi:hypothetical protein GCM10027405_09580 [Arthrobacter alkaliphilus]
MKSVRQIAPEEEAAILARADELNTSIAKALKGLRPNLTDTSTKTAETIRWYHGHAG